MKQKSIQWGIVGPGGIARKFASDLKRVEGGKLHSVAGRDLARAEKLAHEFGADRATDQYMDLASDAAIDIVYLASPHSAHFEIAKKLLEAGKPVLCEKPLTVNAAQAGELIEISRANDVFLMEAMWTRCLPIYARIREWLDEGCIGTPRMMTSNFCTKPGYDPSNRWFNPELAGGGLLDLGVYNLAISQMVMGHKPEKIAAVASFAESGVDEMLSASLLYENGAVSQFTCGLTSHCENSLIIGGDEGFIRVPSPFISAQSATLVADDVTETVKAPLLGGGFEYQIEEAMRCLREGEIECPLIPHADTLATMEVMDEIRRQIGLRYPGEVTTAEAFA
jgi:predicted dehydrogenase